MRWSGHLERWRLLVLGEGSPDFLDDTVDWATCDSEGQLVVARKGVVTVYALLAKHKLTKRFECDLEALAPKKPAVD